MVQLIKMNIKLKILQSLTAISLHQIVGLSKNIYYIKKILI